MQPTTPQSFPPEGMTLEMGFDQALTQTPHLLTSEVNIMAWIALIFMVLMMFIICFQIAQRSKPQNLIITTTLLISGFSFYAGSILINKENIRLKNEQQISAQSPMTKAEILQENTLFLKNHSIPAATYTVITTQGTYQITSNDLDSLCTWAALGWPELEIELRGDTRTFRPKPNWKVSPDPQTHPPYQKVWMENGCRREGRGRYDYQEYANIAIKQVSPKE